MLIFRAFAGLGNRLLTILTLKCNNYLLLLLIEAEVLQEFYT